MDVDKPIGITKYFKKEAPPSPPPKREPSPPHEYVLADNPNIAVSSRASPGYPSARQASPSCPVC